MNLSTGDLVTSERMDRESLCGKKPSCVVKVDLVLENPLELHRVSLHVQDVNDNSPKFKKHLIEMEIGESADKGYRFSIEEAHDADIGQNARSGTVVIHVTVLDANDNAPVFSHSVYKASVPENSPPDTLVINVSATDADKGVNGDVTYELGHLSDDDVNAFLLILNPEKSE
ncbi:hypothetical protein F7725_010154 [Dissostichus mawsoni]|uniref:Cadherin domain-containing protein n=1 Tax=Dissostichus mawsoni TaxID=36200 RepID=A0A7J5XMQ7_DISMA|nr:hypothetical protein F7725_010154 [Dissostichus mawsoni]